jgi:di/tricarboxylate transporter
MKIALLVLSCCVLGMFVLSMLLPKERDFTGGIGVLSGLALAIVSMIHALQ